MAIDPSNVRILLVEDAAIMRKIEIKALKSLGYEKVLEAPDGEAAIDVLKSGEAVDLVISDWNMPKMGGLELVQWIRDQAAFKHLPFLMATGQGDKKQVKKAMEAGVSSFVAKPFNETELKDRILEALGERKEPVSVKEKGPRWTADGKVKLRIAHIQITDHLILGVLKHWIEKKEVTPQHFELETICMGSWNMVQNAIEIGEVDGAFILAPIAMDLFSDGCDIRVVLLAHKNGSIFVRNRSGNYPESLEGYFAGKSVYIPHKMSVHHMLAHLFFSNIGLRPGMVGEGDSNVHFEVVVPVKMQEAIQSNPKAGGFLVAEPLGTRAIASGAGQLQFLSSELWENHPCCVVTMRQDFIAPYSQAMFEFTDLLVQAGKFVEEKPETAAEIGVAFLDPQKVLGLRVPILKNVLKEEKGIKTGDLFPRVDELRAMHGYMRDKMGIGGSIDFDRFIDTRFAEAACKDKVAKYLPSILHDRDNTARELLSKHLEKEGVLDKSMLNLEGKYLTFSLGKQDFGLDIMKIREIIVMQKIRSVPESPQYIMGMINLRGNVIPVMDIRLRFGLGCLEVCDRNCIVITETFLGGQRYLMGLAVESVSEVTVIRSNEVEPPPSFGQSVDMRHILAVAKKKDGVKLLLDIDHILQSEAA
jgi:chemotaxis signal transduction protein/CheY-like chemotaxis protein